MLRTTAAGWCGKAADELYWEKRQIESDQGPASNPPVLA